MRKTYRSWSNNPDLELKLNNPCERYETHLEAQKVLDEFRSNLASVSVLILSRFREAIPKNQNLIVALLIISSYKPRMWVCKRGFN